MNATLPALLFRRQMLGIVLACAGFCGAVLEHGGLGPSTAAAQAPESPAERDKLARARFEQGRDAYKDGRYRDAWALFHEAYQLSGRPELLYNIGQTADRLGQDAEALRAFDMYLEQLPAASNRHDVENRQRALRERLGASKQQAPETLPDQPAPGPANTSTNTAAAWPKSDAPPPPPAAHPARQGFYLRGALGVGFRHDGFSGDAEGSISGVGVSLDIAAGYAIWPGFVLGGGIFFDGTSSPTLSQAGSGDVKLSSANLTTIAAFVDFYPRRETQGVHILGVLGVSALTIDGDDSSNSPSPGGLGMQLGAGYEWPLGGDIAFGVLGRVSVALMAKDGVSHAFASPSLLASITWF